MENWYMVCTFGNHILLIEKENQQFNRYRGKHLDSGVSTYHSLRVADKILVKSFRHQS